MRRALRLGGRMFARLLQGTIRKKLAMLFLLSALPGLVYIALTALGQRDAAVAEALEDLRGFTNQLADAQERTTLHTRLTLENLARLPEVRQGDAVACAALFATMVKVNPQYGDLHLVDAGGGTIASSNPGAAENFARIKHFQDALATRSFASGEYAAGSSPDRPAMAYACPVFGELGEVAGVLLSTVLLESYGRQFDLRRLPRESFVAACDRNGALLLRYPAEGQALAGSPVGEGLFAALRSAPEGVTTDTGPDSVERAVAFRQLRLDGAAQPYMYVFAGIPREAVLEQAQTGMQRAAAVLLFSLALALAAAWRMGGRTVVRRLEELAEGSIRIGLGDYSARVSVDPEVTEIDTLARSFNGMAEALGSVSGQRQETERLLALLAERLQHVAGLGRGVCYSLKEYGGSVFLDWLDGPVEPVTGCSRLEIVEAGGFAHLVDGESAPLYEAQVAGLLPGARGECLLTLRRPDGETVRVRSVALCVGGGDAGHTMRRRIYGLLEPVDAGGAGQGRG